MQVRLLSRARKATNSLKSFVADILDMKTCSKCKKSLPLSAFAKKGTGVQARCRICHSEYTRAHYRKNTQYYKDKATKRNALSEKELRRIVWEYLAAHPCACGEADPVVLDFDHDDPGMKAGNVSRLARRGSSSAKLVEEMSKCTVRCANCHRRRTAQQFDWWKLTYLPSSAIMKPL